MLYEVRVLDPKGKLKNRISTKELSRRHWKAYDEPILFAIKTKPPKNSPKKNLSKTSKSRAS